MRSSDCFSIIQSTGRRDEHEKICAVRAQPPGDLLRPKLHSRATPLTYACMPKASKQCTLSKTEHAPRGLHPATCRQLLPHGL